MQVFRLDLTDRAATDQVLGRVKPDWVLHCAALTDVDYCETHKEDAFRINATLPESLSQCAAKHGARFMHVSTDAVFDGTKGWYTEQDPTSPLNTYARSKLLGEEAVLKTETNVAIRTTMFGWNIQPKLSLAEWILRELRSGRKINGFNDIIFTPLLTTVCAQLMLDLMVLGARGLYHLAGSEACSKYQFARAIAREFHLDAPLIALSESSALSSRAVRPRNTSLNTHKAVTKLNRQMPGLQEQLEQFRREGSKKLHVVS